MKNGVCGWMTILAALFLAAATNGCNRRAEPPPPVPNSKEITRLEKLPAEFCGVWTFQKSSGGMDGQGNAGYQVEKLVIRHPNIIEEHRPGGTVTRDTFTSGRGKSIFSTAEVWQIQRQNAVMTEVLTLSTNGNLTLSENVYDGFSYSFKKVEPSSGGR